MLKIYIGELLSFPTIPLLNYHIPPKESRQLFLDGSRVQFFNIEKNPGEADYFLLPHNYFYAKNDKHYLNSFVELATRHGKKIIVFAYGDSDEKVLIDNVIVLRSSQYRYKKELNEIMVPGLCVDLGSLVGVLVRTKNQKPTVGFCGWGAFPSVRTRVTFFLKSVFPYTISLIPRYQYMRTKLQGVYFRIRSIAYLRASDRVTTNFLIRTSFSGHQQTIALSPEVARRDYVENITNSDFVLCPKGDGNYSLRFFETLSLGRIPILIDTESILPFEDEIPYDTFIVRVPYAQIHKIASIVSERYRGMDGATYTATQKRAREYFLSHLSYVAFYTRIFSELEKKLVS